MKKTNLIFKIATCVLCALSILPIFLNFISLRNGDYTYSVKFSATAGSSDTLVVVSRILFIATIVIAMVLLVCTILQFFFKNDILNWVVLGSAVMLLIIVTLCFVSTLLYCISASELGKYVYFPAIGMYILLVAGVGGSITSMLSNKNK